MHLRSSGTGFAAHAFEASVSLVRPSTSEEVEGVGSGGQGHFEALERA